MTVCWSCWKRFEPENPLERICEDCKAQTKLSVFAEDKQECPEEGGGKKMNGDNRSPERPERNIKIGAVRAAIWRRSHQKRDGTTFESRKVVLDRSYRDASSGEWKNTASLGVNDIPKAILALQKAYACIIGLPEDSSSDKLIEEEIVI